MGVADEATGIGPPALVAALAGLLPGSIGGEV